MTCLSGKFVDDLCHVYFFYNFPIFNSGLDPEHGCGWGKHINSPILPTGRGSEVGILESILKTK